MEPSAAAAEASSTTIKTLRLSAKPKPKNNPAKPKIGKAFDLDGMTAPPLLPAIALETTHEIIDLVPADACVDWHKGEGGISSRIVRPRFILATNDHNFVSR